MFASFTTLLIAYAAFANAASIPARRGDFGSISVTPHAQYSSSIGVLGCKINVNRVAYWPGSIGCNDICVRVTKGDRSLNLLRIDSSAGAHDVSYDAWNYLAFGVSAKERPQMGGGVAMDYKVVDASECADLLDDGKLPLTAANSMNYVASCLNEPNSFVAKTHVLYNIGNSACTTGYDEKCSLNLDESNQPKCPHTLGAVNKLTDLPVENIDYGTGKISLAA
ncbi:Fc.00g055650.m01.CDS01 [Cosmosporella sp. VM-42]